MRQECHCVQFEEVRDEKVSWGLSLQRDGEFDSQISMSGVMATSIGVLRDGM